MAQTAAVRGFNRFYTRVIGVLDEAAARHAVHPDRGPGDLRAGPAGRDRGAWLRRELGLDAGYLSRILARFAADGLMRTERSEADARPAGRPADPGRARGVRPARRALRGARSARCSPRSTPDSAGRLVDAMATIRGAAGRRRRRPMPYVLRPPRPGDLGWVVARHGALYAAEYGWDETFEALVARIVADFVAAPRPRPRGGLDRRARRRAGRLRVLRPAGTTSTAQLRLLLVEPAARGLGIGRPAGRRVHAVRPGRPGTAG